MAKLNLILITGRSTKQGAGISTGKEFADYQEATTVIELSESDMMRSGLSNGDRVRLTTAFGAAEAKCLRAAVPEGLAFMAFGPACNLLIGGETHASGMPDSKHASVELEPIQRETGNGKRGT